MAKGDRGAAQRAGGRARGAGPVRAGPGGIVAQQVHDGDTVTWRPRELRGGSCGASPEYRMNATRASSGPQRRVRAVKTLLDSAAPRHRRWAGSSPRCGRGSAHRSFGSERRVGVVKRFGSGCRQVTEFGNGWCDGVEDGSGGAFAWGGGLLAASSFFARSSTRVRPGSGVHRARSSCCGRAADIPVEVTRGGAGGPVGERAGAARAAPRSVPAGGPRRADQASRAELPPP